MVKYKLNNWAVVSAYNPYLAPELQRQCLMGVRESDGKTVVTSRLVGQYEGKVITSHGSQIELGEPRLDYEDEFPGSKKRLFDTLPQCSLRWDGSIR